MIGNFPPRKCGIATFTRDSFESLRTALPQAPVEPRRYGRSLRWPRLSSALSRM